MARVHLKEDTPFLRTPDMYQIENDAPITEYSEKSLDLIADARNSGIPDGANAFCSVGREKRGTVQMQLFAVIDPKTETFGAVGFRSHGCLAAIACAAAISQMLPGMTIDEALEIDQKTVSDAVDGVPNGRAYTLLFAVEAIKALVGDFFLRVKGYNLAQLSERVTCQNMCVDCLLTENCSLRDERVDQEMREVGEI